MRRLLRVSAALTFVLVAPAPARAQEMTLSVAISMKEAVETLGRQFTQDRSGVMLRYNFGSSGELQKQIEAGAPVDLFISAAQRQMDELEQKGLIVGSTRRVFARNVLTVIKPADSKLDISKPADLLGPRVQRIVIGNPKTVPVGQYSEESLRALVHHRRRGARRARRRSLSAGRRHLPAGDVSGRRGAGLDAAGPRSGVHQPAREPRRADGPRPPRLSATPGRRALMRRSPPAALVTGVAVGSLGGLIGLGGAEFRLPLLVALFGYSLRRAVSLNLATSFVTVAAAGTTRVVIGAGPAFLGSLGAVAVMMALGGMIGARSGSRWLVRVSDSRLRRLVRGLLLLIGALLVVEAALAWQSTGLALGDFGRMALGVGAGILIGAVSSLLGVAGGELIIPTLMFAFGADIKSAGTLSLFISIPAIIVGLASQRAQLVSAGRRDLIGIVVPLGVGSVIGAIAGATLVARVPGAAVKVLLGAVLIVSALKLFGVESEGLWRNFAMRLSARNLLKGRVVEVLRGTTTARVKIDIGGGMLITSSITNEAVDELGLAEGDTAYAVIKASDVMVGKDG